MAEILDAPLLSKDAVKEALDALVEDRSMVRPLGAIAMDTVWALTSAVAGTVVIESWWFRPRDRDLADVGRPGSAARTDPGTAGRHERTG